MSDARPFGRYDTVTADRSRADAPSETQADTVGLQKIAAEVFGWNELTREQLEAMTHLMSGRDVIVVLPTGAGKSAIYQVPTVQLQGLTVVVSPLLALQQDQVDGIAESRAPRAVAVNSTLRAAERRRAWQAVRDDVAHYLFLSPEQLNNTETMTALTALDVRLFVVDEAHCVSAWGPDFRPDYLRLKPVIEQLGHPPVLALTATAAPPVRHDIAAQLGLHAPREVLASFDRPNLHLAVSHPSEDRGKRAAVLDQVLALTSDPATRCGLVYTASRKDAQYYAQQLKQRGVCAAAYHAGLPATDRAKVHQDFLDDRVDVVAATSAFGMGIDKPDVRFVVHASVQESLDSYYQQIGRAGRDGQPARIVLFYRYEDVHLQRFLTAVHPFEDVLSEVIENVRQQPDPLSPSELSRRVDAPRRRVMHALNLLEQTGAIVTTHGGLSMWADSEVQPAGAIERAVELADQQRRLVRSRIEMMRGYAETTGCRRQLILGYFGEQLSQPCGNCDCCQAGTARNQPDADPGFPLNSAVRHADWGNGIVMFVEPDRITVLFEDVGYKILSLPAVRSRHLLSTAQAGH